MIILRRHLFSNEDDENQKNLRGVARTAGIAGGAGLLGTSIISSKNLANLNKVKKEGDTIQNNAKFAAEYLDATDKANREALKNLRDAEKNNQVYSKNLQSAANNKNTAERALKRSKKNHESKGFFGRLFDKSGRSKIKESEKALDKASKTYDQAKIGKEGADKWLDKNKRAADRATSLYNNASKFNQRAQSQLNKHQRVLNSAKKKLKRGIGWGLAGTALAASVAGAGKYLYNNDNSKKEKSN